MFNLYCQPYHQLTDICWEYTVYWIFTDTVYCRYWGQKHNNTVCCCLCFISMYPTESTACCFKTELESNSDSAGALSSSVVGPWRSCFSDCCGIFNPLYPTCCHTYYTVNTTHRNFVMQLTAAWEASEKGDISQLAYGKHITARILSHTSKCGRKRFEMKAERERGGDSGKM